MSDINSYLAQHYLSAEQMAVECSISVPELASLVAEKLVPHASYTVEHSDVLISQAFGELRVRNATPGQYYHPGNVRWVKLALEELGRSQPHQAHRVLKKQFRGRFAAALSELNHSTFRLADSFTDDGEVIGVAVDLRTEDAWNYFVKGVFSLCVADPSSENSIAHKEVLQEALIYLTDNGAKADYSAEEKQRVLGLIDQYERAAMPFSPVEYPLSSRKWLVEDLRRKLKQSK